jgi:hypothetical protein
MSNVENLDSYQYRTSATRAGGSEAPAYSAQRSDSQRQRTREALQEIVFALQINHARACTVIEKIEKTQSRERLRAQSARIGALIDLAWSKLGDI